MRKISVRILAVAVASFAALALQAQVRETAHIVITGGPNAGTHDASTERGGCTYGFAGPGSWGSQLSNPKDKDPKKFNSLQMIVPDAKGAAAGTHSFFLSIGFGPLLNRSAEYAVETRPNEKKHSGSGTVTVADHGTTGSVTFDVKTAEGYRIQGTVDCKSVMRNGK